MSSRKEFLIAGVAAAALPSVAAAAVVAPGSREFTFDSAAFASALDGPQAHKHLFTSVEIENGTVFAMVANTLTGYKQTGVAMADVLPAVVLYHGVGIAMGFDDHAWDTYFIPALAKMKTMTDTHSKKTVAQFEGILKPDTRGNPFFRARGSEDPESSIETLVRVSGMRLFMCNLATRGFSEMLAKTLDRKSDEIYADLAAHAVPNSMLAPSGVWAIHAVQEHKFTYLAVNT